MRNLTFRLKLACGAAFLGALLAGFGMAHGLSGLATLAGLLSFAAAAAWLAHLLTLRALLGRPLRRLLAARRRLVRRARSQSRRQADALRQLKSEAREYTDAALARGIARQELELRAAFTREANRLAAEYAATREANRAEIERLHGDLEAQRDAARTDRAETAARHENLQALLSETSAALETQRAAVEARIEKDLAELEKRTARFTESKARAALVHARRYADEIAARHDESLAGLQHAQTELQRRHDELCNRMRARETAATLDRARHEAESIARRHGEVQLEARLNRVAQALRAERQQRIEAVSGKPMDRLIAEEAARRPAPRPRRCLLIVAPPRSGSTLLLDALRVCPGVQLHPRAILFELLGLSGGRYPRGLCNLLGADLPVEVKPGQGGWIQRLNPTARGDAAPDEALDADPARDAETWFVEKIHPEFYGFDAAAFAARLREVAQRESIEFRLLYLVRHPRASLASFLGYRLRQPRWYRHLDPAAVVDYQERTLASLLALRGEWPGPTIDYADLTARFAPTLIAVLRELRPEADPETLRDAIAWAAEATDRERRFAGDHDGFLSRLHADREPIEAALDDLVANYSELFDASEWHYRWLVADNSLANATAEA